MNHERKVTLDSALFEAMAACYYGGGPDFWSRTGHPRPSAADADTVPISPAEVEDEVVPATIYNGDVGSPFDSSAMSRFAGPGMRVTPMDLAAEQATKGDTNASESGSTEEE